MGIHGGSKVVRLPDRETVLKRGIESLQVCAGRDSLGAEHRRVMSRAGEGRGPVPGSALRRRAPISIIFALVALAALLVTAASASAFTAQGSVKQVYVTGLAPNAQMSLLSSKGATVYTQNANSLGGLLFRNVTPGAGYRVRLTSTGETSGKITVHSEGAAPWNPSVYEQS